MINTKKIILRSDNGGKYTSNNFTKFCQNHGIQHHLTTPYHPAQNGVAEHKYCTLVKAARSMFQIGQKLWPLPAICKIVLILPL